jgi:PTS system nitrogen regulatory IIA component
VTVGATLRLLRVESGFGLREFARRLGVSSAYLSRVENGVDASPTPERLGEMARALDIPATVLLDLAHQVSPLVVDYVARVPEAGSLFLEVAHLGLAPDKISEIRSWIRRTYGVVSAERWGTPLGVASLLTDERIVLQFQGLGFEDLFDVIAGRLGAACGMGAARIARVLGEREAEVSSAIGDGVAIPVVHAPGPPLAALVTLAKPLASRTPDGVPLSLMVVLFGTPPDGGFRLQIAEIARLAARGLARDLALLTVPCDVKAHIAKAETRVGE